MKSKATHMLRVLAGMALGLALAATAALAQQPSSSPQKSADAKTQSSASSRNGDEAGPYNIVSSVEFGYRGLRVDGDINKYQSDLNYKAGPRLFDSSFYAKSKDGGGPFDSLLVTTTGWGADPNGHMRISFEKTKWYRFDGQYRRFKYFRSLNNIANPNYAAPARAADPVTGWHNYDARQQVGDFDLTILPGNKKVRFNVGFSPTRFNGPSYTSWHYGGDDFVFLQDTKYRSNDFRVGADWKLGPVDFSFLQGFRRFNDDSSINEQNLNLGANPTTNTNNAFLRSLAREQPVKGSVNYSRLSAHTLLAKKLDITGRLIYSNATTDFSWLESATGNNFNVRWTGQTNSSPYAPSATNATVLNLGKWDFAGSTKRPNTLFDFGVTYLATDRLRISNTFRVETFQINGETLYNGFFDITQVRTGVVSRLSATGKVAHEVTKYRKIQNTIEGDYEFNDRYSVRFGYRYGSRFLERFFSGNNLGSNPAPLDDDRFEEEENRTDAFFGGIKARPLKDWTLALDVERGTTDYIFTRTGNYDYWNVRARSRYAFNRNFRLHLGFVTKNNSTPSETRHGGEVFSIEDFGIETKSRVFTSSVEWTVNPRLSFSGGYNYNRLNSDAVIRYAYIGNSFCTPGLPTGNSCILGRSQYFVRNHFFNFDVVAQPFNRVTFFAAYRINKDTGQGGLLSNPTGGLLITSYPMSYQSPEARVAIRLNRRVDWNLGYQYYNYRESLANAGNFVPLRPQNYHAHLPYTSLRIYFGNTDR